jgi:arsenate reductase (glutaredoxin)
MKILHNNRCSKSRCALELLQDKGVDFEIVRYLDEPLSKLELKELLVKLNLPIEDIIRKGENEFKENYKGKKMSENEWLDALVRFPKLLERPIVIKGDKAIIARPPERVAEFF